MAFKSPKQRAFYFAKKSGKPPMGPAVAQNATVKSPMAAQPNTMAPESFSIPGLPKSNKFGRIKRNFRY